MTVSLNKVFLFISNHGAIDVALVVHVVCNANGFNKTKALFGTPLPTILSAFPLAQWAELERKHGSGRLN